MDEERDPYNIRRASGGPTSLWIFFNNGPTPRSVVRDLEQDPLVRWQDRWYKTIGLGMAFGVPLLVGVLTGRVLGCLLIGGVLRIVVSHHGTFFINSLCHMVGRQPYSRQHSARDSAVMAVLAFGEGYHNYHHSFPFDYRNGIKGWHFDPAKWLISVLSWIGLTRNLRRAPEAAVLKAKIEIQFEAAKERMQKVVAHSRESYEERLHQAYDRLETAIHDLLALQRRRPAKVDPEHEHLPLETRIGLTYHALEQALREWKQTLRQMNRLPVAVAA